MFRIRVTAIIFLTTLASSCGSQRKPMPFNADWSRNLILTKNIPSSEIVKIEIYCFDPQNASPPSEDDFTKNRPVLISRDENFINTLLLELRENPKIPAKKPVKGQDLNFHILLTSSNGTLAYVRCLWHFNDTDSYGFTIPYGSDGNYYYTEKFVNIIFNELESKRQNPPPE